MSALVSAPLLGSKVGSTVFCFAELFGRYVGDTNGCLCLVRRHASIVCGFPLENGAVAHHVSAWATSVWSGIERLEQLACPPYCPGLYSVGVFAGARNLLSNAPRYKMRDQAS